MRNNRASGFTLLELMIVVVVIAILATLAFYNYARYGFRARRSDGHSLLAKIASAEERYYTNYNSYTSSVTGANPTGLAFGSTTSENGYYTVAAATASAGQTYTLTATPVAGKPQANDQCQKLTLTNTGVQGFSGNQSNGNCW